MKNNKLNTENPRKNNYFVSIIRHIDGKTDYNDIVFTSKKIEDCFDFTRNNYTRSVSVAIKTYSEMIRAGVEAKKMIDFKNPKIY